MNTLTVPEQREAESERGLNVAFLLFSLVTLCAIFLGCAFLYGKYEGRQEAKAEYDARPLPIVLRGPVLQVPEGECREIQKLRERMAKIRGKQG